MIDTRANAHTLPAERFKHLVELAPDGILIHDGDVVVAVNAAMVRLAGASNRQQLIGATVDSLFHPPHLKAVGQQLAGGVREDAPVPAVRDTLNGVDGRQVEVDVRAQVFLEHDQLTAYMVIRDITDRLVSEAALRTLAAHVQASQRLAAVESLAAGVAHEVNNMLQIIMSLAAMLADNADAIPETRDDGREILVAASRATVVTRQLLEFSRLAPHRPTTVDARQTLTTLMPELRRCVGGTRRLLHFGDDTATIKIDVKQLELILINLLLNARRATSNGDAIALRNFLIDHDGRSPGADGVSVPAGRYVAISVSDNGIGMSATTKGRAFEPFFTTQPVGMGSGLGLSAVQGMTAQNGGFITVTSALKVGSTFTLLFPSRHP